jgi:Leucine-rich repeat (LRR) protein
VAPLAGLSNLSQLNLNSNQISNLTPLAGLTSLNELLLYNNQISNLTPLAGLTSLNQLLLYNNQISNLTPLAGLTSLTGLYLSSNQISDLSPLAGLTSLTGLYLSSNQISDLTPLAGLTSLRWLDLSSNQISDLLPLVNNTGLATGDMVWLSGNVLSQTSANVHIPALQARGVIVFWDGCVVVTFPDANLEAAVREALNKPVGDINSSELAGLWSLNASSRGIIDLTGLEYCTGLNQLDLRDNQINDLASLAGLTNLTQLYLQNNQISDIAPLVDNSGLATGDTVWLSSNPLSQTSITVHIPALQARGVMVAWDDPVVVTFPDANLEAAIRQAVNKPVGDIHSSELAGLTDLWAGGRGIVNLSGLEYCTNLQWLNLNNNQISNLTPVAGLTTLTWLELSSNQISNLSPLAGLASLQGLGLSSNQISNLIPLAGLTNLYQLNLDNNQISNLSPLAGLTSLQWLTLSSNQISDVSPLAGLTSLQWLELSSNQISDLTPLAGLISLNDLFLYNNQISDLTPLTGLTNLNWLDVNNNQISDIKPLVDNAGLWYGDYVYLQGNPLSQTSIDEYIPALRAKGVKVFWDNQPPSPAPGPIQPETTQWQTLNTPAVGNEILSPSEVNKIAVAADGATIWAVDTPAKAIRKSYHRGWTWSEAPNSALHSAMTAAGISQDNQFIWDVVLAPDNSNMVAVVTGSASSPDPTEVWMSTNGGTMWVCADFSAVSGGAIIGAVDISRDYGTGRDIAVGARDGVPGAFRLWVLQTPGSNPWKLQTMVPAANADIVALKFSPNYLADASLGVVYCTDSATYYNIALRDRDPAANDIVNWVYVTPGIEVRNQDSPPDASPEATTIVNADLELPRDFDGQNAGLRRAYISTNSLGAGTKATTARDGIFRIDDTTVYTLMDTSQIPAKSICSLAYSGTYASGKLLAGEALGYPCSATVPTWFTDSPTECPIPCWYPALKPPTGAAAQGTCSQVSKNGFGNAQVAWSPDYGAVAYCGTSSADFRNGGVNTSPGSGCWPAALRTTIALDESAFSVTRNNGETWNQLGMIDTRIDKLTDVAPSADSSTIYLASINDTDVAGGGCTGFDSVWRTSSNLDVTSPFPLTPIGACWERVLTRITSENCTAPQTNQALLRVVPYGADPTGEIVAWGAYDPSSSLAHGVAAWSPDHGDYWQNIPVRHPVQDFCFESRTILYFLNPGGLVQKMPYTGTTWSTALPDVSTGLGSGNSIAAIPTGNVLVGGGTSSSFPVAYSANGAQSFTAITEPLDPATVLVAFDAGFSSNGTIYAATREANSGGTIYRNTLPSPGQWTNLKPLQLGYYGLVTGSKGPLYAANPLFVERTLNPDTGIPGDIGEWDVLISNLLDFPIRIGLQPNSLKLSDQTGQAAILYFVEDHEYAPESNAGGLWTYADCLAGTGPQLIETMPIVCDPTLHMPPVFSLSWMPSCFEKFYELQVADTDNFTAGSWRHLWYQPPDASSPSLLIPPGGMPVTSENTPGWVGTLSDSISNILGVSPDMQVIGLEPTISVPSLQPECGHTYYWRIRAVGSTQGDIIRSPWSETESFTISNALPSAASVNSATGTGVVTFSSDIGTITDLTAVAEGTLPIAGKPAGIIFPHGLFSFRIIGIPPGATATVTITFPSSLPEGTQYWKYQSGIGWYQIPIVSHVANVIVIRLTDGGLGDADMVINQIIVDPGGSGLMPGVVAAIPALSTTPTTTQSPRSSSPPPQTLWLPPADVRLHTLSVSPGQAQIGQPVTVLANVVNNGGSSGSYDVILRINGKMEQQRIIEVSPGTAYPVKFIVTKSQPGTYTVNIGDKKGSFIILGSGRPVRDMREGPALVAAMVVIVLLFCLVILIARRRIQGY